MKYGLSEKQHDEIISFIKEYSEVEEAILFGSRAIDTYKEASDVDIALKGKNVTASLAAKMKFNIEEDSDLPFFFDFIAYPTIENTELKKHINGKGKSLFCRGMSEWQKTEIGRIPNHWRIWNVDEIKSPEKKSIISGPFGSNISAKFFVEFGVPVIRGNNLSLALTEKFKDDGFVFITKEKAKELNTWAKPNDIIFTAVGTIGQVGVILNNQNFKKYIISNKQLRLTVDENKVLPLYAYYWFASPLMVDIIKQRNTWSSVPLINLSVLKSLNIPTPPLTEQKVMAEVLSSLDDKIDLLHRQNKTLEKMAETLFRQWFVEEAGEDWEEVTISQFVDLNSKSITKEYLVTKDE